MVRQETAWGQEPEKKICSGKQRLRTCGVNKDTVLSLPSCATRRLESYKKASVGGDRNASPCVQIAMVWIS